MNHRHDWSDWWVSGYSQTARDKQAVARWKIQRRVCFVCAKSERREVPISTEGPMPVTEESND